MKKLLFVLALTFIGQQVFSQMYIVAVQNIASNHPNPLGCSTANNFDRMMTTIDPLGNITYQCLPRVIGSELNEGAGNLVLINQEFNSILSQGYKLVHASPANSITSSSLHGIWYFAIP